jgi:CheY-specific phosphatase CheX
MTPASDKPDLRRIGESAFMEVLDTLLMLSATGRESANDRPVSAAPEEISSSVLLTGQRISGSVHLRLPLAFVAYAVRRLTGLDGDTGNTSELQDDAAGELANMVAGRVASQFAAHAYPCKLGTPSVSRSARLATQNRNDLAHGRTDLICEGHWLSLEIQCCYANP